MGAPHLFFDAMKYTVVLLLALLPTWLGIAQNPATATLLGRVTETYTDIPIAGATVQLAGTNRGTAASANGFFRVDQLQPGSYTFIVSALGYTSARETVELQPNETYQLAVTLLPTVMALGEVTVEAAGRLTGGPRGIRDLPGSATLLTPAALQRFADTDVHRLLAEVPGVQIQEEEGYGLRPNIGIRGTGTERSSGITLMEDGVLIAPAPYAAPAAYYFPPTGRLDGLEIRKGAAQIAYGPYTTGGAINLLAVDIPTAPATSLDVRTGTDQARTLHLRTGTDNLLRRHSTMRLGVIAEVFADGVDGFKQLAWFDNGAEASTRPFVDPSTGYELWSILSKMRLSFTPSARTYHAIELKVTVDEQTSNETYLGLTPADFSAAPNLRYAGSQLDQFESTHSLFHLRYVGVWGERFDVTATAYGTRFDRNWHRLDTVSDGLFDDADADRDGLFDTDLRVPINAILADPLVWSDELAVVRGDNAGQLSEGRLLLALNNRQHRANGVELQAQFRPQGTTPSSPTFKLGVRLHSDEADRLQRRDAYTIADGLMTFAERGVNGDSGNRIDEATAFASFLEADVPFGRLTVTPGLRMEHVRQKREDYGFADPDRTGTNRIDRENTITAFIPGLGIRYDLNAKTVVFSSIHRGFAPPSSQPGVDPEQSINVELGARYEREAWLSAQAVAFLNNYSNLLGADFASSGGAGTGNVFNGGEARVYGLEASASADVLTLLGQQARVRVPVRLVYTYTDARFESNFVSTFLPWGTVREGDRLPYVVPQAVTVGIGLETNRSSLNLRTNWTAETRDRAGQGPIAESERVDARLLIDLSAETTLNTHGTEIRLFATVRNLTDEVYVAARRPAGLRPGLPRTFLVGLILTL